MSKDKFQAKYQVEDGYAGKDRPRHFNIDPSQLEDDMDDGDLERFYEEAVQEHFEQNIAPAAERVDEFIAWAKARIAERQSQ